MITVGFKEGSKGLGLGFGYEGETREGEIWNPDITFSNLDERLEKVLGAFRKDFKGGIPSGNSGPIYGAYGSFLPVYHRTQGGRVREGFSDPMKTKKRSSSLTDRDFISVYKKSKVDDMDCLSAKDRHKYGIRPSKARNRDITFSNLDERLEKALGAFRKDFKGGISSGNLGPIYGAYGSFLPAYRRPQGGRVREGFSDRMKMKKRSLSLTDRDFISVCKKSKVDDMDPLSVSASAKDRHKYDLHPSKSRKCEASKSLKSSVSGSQDGTVTHSLPSVHGSQNENGKNSLLADGFMDDNALKTLKQDMNLSEKQNANQSIAAATDALKEAVKLMDYADRIQKSGSNSEGMNLSFEAALKYLHAAWLLESGHGQSEMILQSMQTYRRVAELCESCAHEYEKSKDMAAAALAYKCMEVAYMRIISSSHASARKDRHELQRDLKIVPLGEYPSSSGSDVDNLGSPSTLDNVVAAWNRPIVRLLNFAGDVNSAMEASMKSRIAFAAAKPRVEDGQFREGITFVKKALDFSFQDVQGLLWLVRQALEAISH
ncbi:Protein GrpE like [Actinidia chinensis var. chinensis]|uniref:Protein GrpE like n=1 Tax=Actinidia chinensis var. chinensis TaxID=1590841 RepID=A0A2R6S0M9_ACTCC|nr:Protein GrpE like [Actinidia chinensis var. chinensis]